MSSTPFVIGKEVTSLPVCVSSTAICPVRQATNKRWFVHRGPWRRCSCIASQANSLRVHASAGPPQKPGSWICYSHTFSRWTSQAPWPREFLRQSLGPPILARGRINDAEHRECLMNVSASIVNIKVFCRRIVPNGIRVLQEFYAGHQTVRCAVEDLQVSRIDSTQMRSQIDG